MKTRTPLITTTARNPHPSSLNLGKTTVFLALFLGSSLSSTAASAVIVNWTVDQWVSSSQDLQGRDSTLETGDFGSGSAIDSRRGREFSTLTPLNPSSAVYDTSLDSAIFYGGAVTTDLDSDDPGNFIDYSIANQGPNDSIGVEVKSNQSVNLQSVYYWDQSNFLNGGDSASVSLNSLSSFHIEFANISNGLSDGGGEGRWVVRNDGQFYISETLFAGAPNDKIFTLNNFGTVDDNWALYNPSGLDIDFDDGAAAFTFKSDAFDDITGVGFYVAHDEFSTNNLQYQVHTFSVDADLIPEPSSSALLGLGSLGLLLRRRR